MQDMEQCSNCKHAPLAVSEREEEIEVGGLVFRAALPVWTCEACGKVHQDPEDRKGFELAIARTLLKGEGTQHEVCRFARMAVGLSVAELANGLDLSPDEVERWESGKDSVEHRATEVLLRCVEERISPDDDLVIWAFAPDPCHWNKPDWYEREAERSAKSTPTFEDEETIIHDGFLDGGFTLIRCPETTALPPSCELPSLEPVCQNRGTDPGESAFLNGARCLAVAALAEHGHAVLNDSVMIPPMQVGKCPTKCEDAFMVLRGLGNVCASGRQILGGEGFSSHELSELIKWAFVAGLRYSRMVVRDKEPATEQTLKAIKGRSESAKESRQMRDARVRAWVREFCRQHPKANRQTVINEAAAANKVGQKTVRSAANDDLPPATRGPTARKK